MCINDRCVIDHRRVIDYRRVIKYRSVIKHRSVINYRKRLAMKTSTGTPLPLGVTCSAEAVNFSIAVPQGKSCTLQLYKTGEKEATHSISLTEQHGIGDVRFIMVEELEAEIEEYLYIIDGKPMIDPYARELTKKHYLDGADLALSRMSSQVYHRHPFTSITHTTSFSLGEASSVNITMKDAVQEAKDAAFESKVSYASIKARHINIAEEREFGQNIEGTRGRFRIKTFDWKEDRRPHHKDSDVIAYSVHVRGFTKHSSSKVKEKGTFAGLQQKLPYLVDLGINQIQLMPVYEFQESLGNKVNYWGYGAGYYYAPKATYSASEEPSRELKELIYHCHKLGVEVVLEMPFDAGVPANLAIDILRFYMLEYHVDGFVVIPYYVSWEMLKDDPLIKGAKLYRKNDDFRNVTRRFLKGDENMVGEVMRVITSNTAEDGYLNYITGQTGFTLLDLVSYDGKHNEANGENNVDGPDYNYSWNCGAEGPSRKKDVTNIRKGQLRNAFMLLLLAQGTPVLLQGDEFANSQKGNNNAYCQDNEITWLNWSNLKRQVELHTFVKQLIAFRRSSQVLHQDHRLLGVDTSGSGIPDISFHGDSPWNAPNEVASRRLGVLFCGTASKDVDVYIAYNMHWITHTFALPTLPKRRQWSIVIQTEQGFIEQTVALTNQKSIQLTARTIVVLIGR